MKKTRETSQKAFCVQGAEHYCGTREEHWTLWYFGHSCSSATSLWLQTKAFYTPSPSLSLSSQKNYGNKAACHLAENETEFQECGLGMLRGEHCSSRGMWLLTTAHISHPLHTLGRLPSKAFRDAWAKSRCSNHAGPLPDSVPFHFCSHIGMQKCGCEFLKAGNITFIRVKNSHAWKMCKTYGLQWVLWAPKPVHKWSSMRRATIPCSWGAEFSSFSEQLMFYHWVILQQVYEDEAFIWVKWKAFI